MPRCTMVECKKKSYGTGARRHPIPVLLLGADAASKDGRRTPKLATVVLVCFVSWGPVWGVIIRCVLYFVQVRQPWHASGRYVLFDLVFSSSLVLSSPARTW